MNSDKLKTNINEDSELSDEVKKALKANVDEDSELSYEVKEALKALINGINDDENLKDLACYMRGDDKKYGKLHRNSKFTNSIIKHVRKLHLYLLQKNNTPSTDRANKLYYWLWKHMGKPIRYKHFLE